MKNNYFREWCFQERRYQRAKRKAEKHIRLTDAWIKIMKDAADKQKRICREEAEEKCGRTDVRAAVMQTGGQNAAM